MVSRGWNDPRSAAGAPHVQLSGEEMLSGGKLLSNQTQRRILRGIGDWSALKLFVVWTAGKYFFGGQKSCRTLGTNLPEVKKKFLKCERKTKRKFSMNPFCTAFAYDVQVAAKSWVGTKICWLTFLWSGEMKRNFPSYPRWPRHRTQKQRRMFCAPPSPCVSAGVVAPSKQILNPRWKSIQIIATCPGALSTNSCHP